MLKYLFDYDPEQESGYICYHLLMLITLYTDSYDISAVCFRCTCSNLYSLRACRSKIKVEVCWHTVYIFIHIYKDFTEDRS